MLIPDKTTRSCLRSFAKNDGISREELLVLRQKINHVSLCLLLLPVLSKLSTSSEVPEEIVFDQDAHLVIELSHVNDLYFANETPAPFVPMSDSDRRTS